MKQLKKTLFVLCTVSIILLMCCVCAAAETYDEYIVYPKQSSRRFRAAPKNTKTDCILVSDSGSRQRQYKYNLLSGKL